MAYSKYDKELTYDTHEFCVHLINTKRGPGSVFGGHAKIVVEGLKENNSLFPELFVGEYHIMEAERLPDETWLSWVPQCLKNTKCQYLVLYKEDNKYTRDDGEYAAIQSRSHGGIAAAEAMKMIDAIKEEHRKIDAGELSPDFQYAGEWCVYGLNGAHNCTTWAEEKLNLIGIGKYFITDSSKAMPFVHANAPDSSGCALF